MVGPHPRRQRIIRAGSARGLDGATQATGTRVGTIKLLKIFTLEIGMMIEIDVIHMGNMNIIIVGVND